MNSIFSRFGKAFIIMCTQHKNCFLALFAGIGLLFLRFFVFLFMLADNLFFPGFRKKKTANMIVISGSPRTGSTFVQRFLEKTGAGTGTPLSLLSWPSILLQKLLNPFMSLLNKMGPGRFYDRAIHDTSLRDAESDDIAVTSRFADGVFFNAYFLAFDRQMDMQELISHSRKTADRDFRWLQKIWKRNLYLRKSGPNLTKLFSLPVNVPYFQKKYPEARIIYIVREPAEALPSVINLLESVLKKLSKPKIADNESRKVWAGNLYKMFAGMQKCFHNDWVSGRIDRDRVFILQYSRLLDDFEKLMNEILAFLGVTQTDETRKAICEQAALQRDFVPEQFEALENFGYDRDRMKKDFSFYYSEFLSRRSAGQ